MRLLDSKLVEFSRDESVIYLRCFNCRVRVADGTRGSGSGRCQGQSIVDVAEQFLRGFPGVLRREAIVQSQ
jgi:hypothetical protein